MSDAPVHFSRLVSARAHFSTLVSSNAGIPIRVAQRRVLSRILRLRQRLASHAPDQDLQIADGIGKMTPQVRVVAFHGAVFGDPTLTHVFEPSKPVTG